MFALDAAFALGFLALVAGTALLMLSGKEEMGCRGFGKVVAYVTIIASILILLCTSYYGTRYWVDGYFEYPHGMMMKHGKGKCPMMERGRRGVGMRDGPRDRRMMRERMEERGKMMQSPMGESQPEHE